MTVSLALAKSHLRVDGSDEDLLIQQYIDASSLLIEKMAGVLLTRREVTQQFASFSTRLPLFWGPDPDEVTVTYVDTDDADQEITDARVVRDWLYANEDGWPSIADESVIEVTYTAGFETAPADLVSAQLLLIGQWFDVRSASSDKPMAQVPLAVDALVQPYRRVFV